MSREMGNGEWVGVWVDECWVAVVWWLVVVDVCVWWWSTATTTAI